MYRQNTRKLLHLHWCFTVPSVVLQLFLTFYVNLLDLCMWQLLCLGLGSTVNVVYCFHYQSCEAFLVLWHHPVLSHQALWSCLLDCWPKSQNLKGVDIKFNIPDSYMNYSFLYSNFYGVLLSSKVNWKVKLMKSKAFKLCFFNFFFYNVG